MNEDEKLFSMLRDIFTEKILFNKVLGLSIKSMDGERVCLKFAMRDELIGNYLRGSLHGGVISSALDVSGGLVAFLAMATSMKGKSPKQKMERFAKLGTIDLRIDYLRPGLGKEFFAKGFILRLGKKVAVTRMELQNDKDTLIALGTGAYIVS